MSYEIIYDKQFIKVKDNLFVPMVLSGSNNCTEMTTRQRRARSWFALNIGNSSFFTKEEMLKHCEDERIRVKAQYNNDEDKYSDATFGSWSGLAIGSTTNKVSFGNYKGIFVTGMKKAVTVETLALWNISVNISTYCYDKDGYNGLDSLNEYPKTSEALYDMYNDAIELYKDTKASVYISLDYYAEKQVPRMRKSLFGRNRTRKERVNVDSFWTVKVSELDSYFVRKIKYGYKHAYYPYLKYVTEAEAKRKVKQIKNVPLEVEHIKESAFI